MEYNTKDKAASTDPVQLIGILLLLKDLYSTSFWHVTQFFSKVFRSDESKSSKVEVATKKLGIERSAGLITKNSFDDERNSDSDEELSIGELTMVMSELGTCYDPDGDKLQGRLGPSDITALFEEEEPSLQEIKEAFHLYDENKDGFIDEKELRKIIFTLCIAEVSEADCRRMIRAYDDNGDGAIDFNEFVRLVAKSLS